MDQVETSVRNRGEMKLKAGDMTRLLSVHLSD